MTQEISELLVEGNLRFQWNLLNEAKYVNINRKIPKHPVLILTCMDSRIDIHKIFQLNLGEVLILRNAGNVYSKDIMRSILLAIYEFEIKTILILGHLDCGMTKVNVKNLKQKLPLSLVNNISNRTESPEKDIRIFFKIFDDEIKNIKTQVRFLKEFPDFPKETEIRGMLYDVNTGWVFESKEFEQLESREDFLKSYKKLLMKKHSKLTKFVESLKKEQDELDQLNKIAPLEKCELNHFRNFMRVNTKTLKMASKIFKPKKTINTRIKPVKVCDNEKDFRSLGNLKMEIVVPKCVIPKINVLIPNFKLYYEEELKR
ncbi:MAG: carbonic anhydrase [Promethearchaeota archaeon]|nr:MAG: carbonic anhydrase [Candidatus Lokiarchaeota archaeon]